MIVGTDRQFVALDVETTGLDFETDRVIEVGAIRFDAAGAVLATWDRLLNPGRGSTPGALAVHGIADETVALARPSATVLAELLAWLDDAGDPARLTLVAHNAAIDAGFLGLELARAGLSMPGAPVVDTLAWVRRVRPEWRPVRLANLADRLGVSPPERHRALADAERVRAVFQALRAADSDPTGRPPLAYPLRDARTEAPRPWGWDDVAEAIERGDSLRIAYDGGSHGLAPRLVRPARFEFRGGAIFLVAFCPADSRDKEFQIDRIVSREVVSDPTPPRGQR